jgi:MoaA/NifB/PqqE/SkfB family radical SAM enzyme
VAGANMTYINIDNLNVINAELTDYCNASCPMCARFKWDGSLYQEKVNKNHTTLNLIKKIPIVVIRRLKKFYSVGTYGDPLMNPETADIYEYVRTNNPTCKLEMHSNGGGRDENFWSRLAKIGIHVLFGIDGLQDTNHLYRRNVNWNKLVKNVTTFIDAGGSAQWKFIIFKHNEHQIEEAREFSKKIGFNRFIAVYSDRWKEYNWVTGKIRDITKWPVDNYYIEKPSTQEKKYYCTTSVKVSSNKFDTSEKIECWACTGGKYEIYLRANGNVQPCCMLGDLDVHESKRLINDVRSINLQHTTLEKILVGEYFKKLSQGINGSQPEYRIKNCFYSCGVSNV